MKRRQLLKSGVNSLLGVAASSMLPTGLKANSATALSSVDVLRLCYNENPYGPSPMAHKAIMEQIQFGNHYPRPMIGALKKAIAEENKLTEDHVLLAPGSASILQLVGLWVGQQQKNILSADYTFRWLMRYAAQFGSRWIKTPLTSDYYFDLDGIGQKITEDIGLIYLCNPNNPTGTYIAPELFHPFLKNHAAAVPIFVDEAYVEYIETHQAQNTAHLIDQYPQLMVCRTFSKLYGLAGLRVGYLLADPVIIKQLDALDIGLGMNVSNTSSAAALASLKDKQFKAKSITKNAEARHYLQDHLTKWGLKYQEGSANFVHCDVSPYRQSIKAALDERSILMNPITRADKTYLRITIGTQEEMEQFVSRMDRFFN